MSHNHDWPQGHLLSLMHHKSQWIPITRHTTVSKMQTDKNQKVVQFAIVSYGKTALCLYFSETESRTSFCTWNYPSILIKNELDFPNENLSLWNCCIHALWKNECNWKAICQRMPGAIQSYFRDIEHAAKIFHCHLPILPHELL